MTSALPLMVFSDLDGTLIDHHSYDWTPARPALQALNRVGAGVVLASSKTAPEIDVLRREMALTDWPAIVENGAGVLRAGARPEPDAETYRAVRRALEKVPGTLRRQFVGFGDMRAQDVSAATGLSRDRAVMAQARAFSEPGVWQGSDAHKADFLAHLEDAGLHAQQGGRFLTLSFGATKADQVRALTQEYGPARTMALGDAPNDIKMLEACDVGVIIANPSRAPLPVLAGEAEGRILRMPDAGPAAWNRAVLKMLAQFNLM